MSDYYSGYYWGTNPYSSSGLEGKITDAELKDKVIERINSMHNDKVYDLKISIKNGIVTLKGSVVTFQDKRIIAREIWGIIGVSKVLNLLKVSDPMTAGPRIQMIDDSSIGQK